MKFAAWPNWKPFCYQQYNIQPDLLTLAKGLGEVSIGAMVANESVPGFACDHASNLAGNPLACAAANKVLTY